MTQTFLSELPNTRLLVHHSRKQGFLVLDCLRQCLSAPAFSHDQAAYQIRSVSYATTCTSNCHTRPSRRTGLRGPSNVQPWLDEIPIDSSETPFSLSEEWFALS